MKVFIRRGNGVVDAKGEFDPKTKSLTVRKGSKVSPEIHYSEKFRGAKSIERQRAEYVDNNVVIKDVKFKSPSTAANFVTGCSTNGLTAWKNEKNISIKKVLTEE